MLIVPPLSMDNLSDLDSALDAATNSNIIESANIYASKLKRNELGVMYGK